tara:strand:+ start:494 stop:697 length:204 start_codon:yes stop_codon:yes gene_type:complete
MGWGWWANKEIKMKKKHLLRHLDSAIDRLLNLISSGDHESEQLADIILDLRDIHKRVKRGEDKNETS